MQVATIDAPQQATGTTEETILSDRTTLQYFIIKNGTELRDLCHDAAKHKLFFTTPDAIIGKLLSSLHRYGGPPVESDFMEWARRFVAKEAARYEITGRILDKYQNLIFDAIRRSVWTSAENYAVEPKDIFWEVSLLIFQRAHSLDRKGTAKLSSRLYSLVAKHIYMYHNKKNLQRRNAVQLHRNEFQCEHFSDEELAAMKADKAEEAEFSMA
jgi:hypothetical protein